MPRSKLNDYAKSLTGPKAAKRDPMMERIKGRISTAHIPPADLQKALGREERSTRNRMAQFGGEWTINDIVSVCKVIGLPVQEVLSEVSERYYG